MNGHPHCFGFTTMIERPTAQRHRVLKQSTLVIAADRLLRPCRAVWSADRQIGVAFD
jgi:hypothetical protein